VSPRRWQDRLRDIVAAVEEILAFAEGMDLKAFAADAKTQKAVLADIALIGEAARHVPVRIAEAHPEIPWRDMQDMRNFVAGIPFPLVTKEDPQAAAKIIFNSIRGMQHDAGEGGQQHDPASERPIRR